MLKSFVNERKAHFGHLDWFLFIRFIDFGFNIQPLTHVQIGPKHIHTIIPHTALVEYSLANEIEENIGNRRYKLFEIGFNIPNKGKESLFQHCCWLCLRYQKKLTPYSLGIFSPRCFVACKILTHFKYMYCAFAFNRHYTAHRPDHIYSRTAFLNEFVNRGNFAYGSSGIH